MSRKSATHKPALAAGPTLWGLTPLELHDRYWASRRVQVIRPGQPAEISRGARLFLLIPRSWLVDFDLRGLRDVLFWRRPRVLRLRLAKAEDSPYREQALFDGEGRFTGYERRYGGTNGKSLEVALARDPAAATAWQRGATEDGEEVSFESGFQGGENGIIRAVAAGKIYHAADPNDLMAFMTHALRCWRHPNGTIGRLMQIRRGVWADREAAVEESVSFLGPAWVGAGRRLVNGTRVLGPAVLWDDPNSRPAPESIAWPRVSWARPARGPAVRKRIQGLRALGKRAFDVAFSALAILLSLPLYPIVMLAIYLEDGRPFFFVHWRETLGGRLFPCLKFRTMRRDADELKEELMGENVADGPQFYIQDDPRMLRVGNWLRKMKIDETPQFFNVLLGHMSVVGPRPSPFDENQFCPTWREARLSVRPGITGLWQVMRTRRPGLDFQEWIRYDVEYVEKVSIRLDLWILWRTVLAVLRFR